MLAVGAVGVTAATVVGACGAVAAAAVVEVVVAAATPGAGSTESGLGGTVAAITPGAAGTVGGLGGSVVCALGSTGKMTVHSPNPCAASAPFGPRTGVVPTCAAELGGTVRLSLIHI